MQIILILIVLLCIFVAFSFNKLVKHNNLVQESWSGVDVQLKKRFDLIPNLVETVKAYASHEAKTLSNTIEKRAEAIAGNQSTNENSQQEKTIGLETKALFAVAEAYPELKASKNFQSLHKNLISIEDDLQYARRYFNGTVRDYNTVIESFPSNLIARAFEFKTKDFFEIEYATERKTPDVSL